MRFVVLLVLSWISVASADTFRFSEKTYRFSGAVDQSVSLPTQNRLKGVSGGEPLSFRSSALPPWLTLNPKTGVVSGRAPQEPTEVSFRLEARQKNAVALADFYFSVKGSSGWKSPQISLGKWRLDEKVVIPLPALTTHCKLDCSFEAKNLPAWLKYDAPSQSLVGVAAKAGKFENMSLRVSPASSDRAVAVLEVIERPKGRLLVLAARANLAEPVILVDPLTLPLATVGKDFKYDYSSNVRDAAGVPSQYQLAAGPKWLKIEEVTGVLSGKPDKAGDVTAVISVSNASGAIQGGALLTVLEENQPPVLVPSALSFVVAERAEASFNLADPKYVISGSKSLQFTLSASSEWATLSQEGVLALRPLYAHLGMQFLDFEVRDGNLSTKGILRVQVTPSPRAPVWDAAIQVVAKVGVALNEDLSSRVKDLDRRPLGFTKKSGPRWVGVTAEGVLIGTPPDTDLGATPVEITAANESLSATGAINLTVQMGNRPPKWKAEPSLADARVGEDFTASLRDLVEDPDGDRLVFKWLSGPTWFLVATDGTVSGRPRPADQGPNRVRVQATDSNGVSTDATVFLNVAKANSAPKWNAPEPLELGRIQAGKKYSRSLSGLAADEDGDPVVYRKVQGPIWITVSPEGLVEGVAPAQTGLFAAVFTASDNKKQTDIGVKGEVVPLNRPPLVPPFAFEIDERREVSFKLTATAGVDPPDGVVDPDRDPLVFSLSSVAWATLSPEGVLKVRATFDQIGNQSLDFDVTDGKDVVSGTIAFKVNRVPRPPVWQPDPVKLKATAGVPFVSSLRPFAQDRDGLALEFERDATGPQWLTVKPDGSLEGKPTDADALENNFVIRVKNDKLAANAALVITVFSDNSPPQWRKPVVLPAGKVGKWVSESLAGFAFDPDVDDELYFEKEAGPDWAFVTNRGLLIGPPEPRHEGNNTFQVRVVDSRGASASAPVSIVIGSNNQAPVWSNPTIPLGNARVDQDYGFDLAPFASDPDRDRLFFRKRQGPEWLKITEEGFISGKPAATDAGDFNPVFEVSDGKAFVPVDSFIRVLGGVKPPKITGELKFTFPAGQTFKVDLAKQVEDPVGGLVFSLLSSQAWVDLSVEGVLTLRPPVSAKGKFTIDFKVANSGGASSEGQIEVTLDTKVEAPRWLDEVIDISAAADTEVKGNFIERARDLAQLPLSFTKKSGPDWLAVNPDGRYSGRTTPEMAKEVQVFKISASNGFVSSDVDLEIRVQANYASDRFVLSNPAKRTKADVLFVLDHTTETAAFYDAVMRETQNFFYALSQAEVDYSIGVMSARGFTDRLVWDKRSQYIVTPQEPNPSAMLADLVERTRRNKEKFPNSPIWAMQRLFSEMGKYSLYPQFDRAGVPLFVFVITSSSDQNATLRTQAGLPAVTPSEVGSEMVRVQAGKQKALQVSVLVFGKPEEVAKGYGAFTKAANGQYYEAGIGGTGMTEFGEVVAQNAQRLAVRSLKLSRLVNNPAQIQVVLKSSTGTLDLKGGTGSSTDAWRWDSENNRVVLQWWNIPGAFDPLNDEIIVSYP
jgi:hypothetical protein